MNRYSLYLAGGALLASAALVSHFFPEALAGVGMLGVGMTTLAANKPRAWEIGDESHVPAVAADIIYEGAAVGDNGSGYGRPLVAADPFRGFALQQCDNSAGAAGDKNIRVQLRGQIRLAVTSAAITDVDKAVYASDDDTFTFTATGNSYVGRVKRWDSTGFVIVAFDAVRGTLGKLTSVPTLIGPLGFTANTGNTNIGTIIDTSVGTQSAASIQTLAQVTANVVSVVNELRRQIQN